VTSKITTPDPGTSPDGLRHDPFLHRAAERSDRSPNERALGAFLTLRLVDRVVQASGAGDRDALDYQIRATSSYLGELQPPTVETNHLLEIVRVAESAGHSGKRRLLFPPLLAFAYWLEQELRLAEALDVLDSAITLSPVQKGEEEIATHLQRGRVLRLLGMFERSRAAYEDAAGLARRIGDQHSDLLSQIGCALVHQKVGNLPAAERALRAAMYAAQNLGDRDVEARACHDLAGTLHFMGRAAASVELAFRAYQLYEDPARRMRALSDTGMFLKELGHYAAAKHALLAVVDGAPPPESLSRAVVELIDLSALMQDRMSFERWRRAASAQYGHLPTDERAELEIKLGRGFAAFGRFTDSEACLKRAITMAEACGLGELVFRAESLIEEVRTCRDASWPLDPPITRATPDPALQPTLDRLETLGAGL
jgi:tetratricopeptide (TPR) repeat protein